MSGHLLASVNPEAVQHDVPPIGARVQFFCRPGMGRGNKTVFGADVVDADPRTGACTLTVFYGREDQREFPHVRKRSEQEPYQCWDYMPDGYDALVKDLDVVEEGLQATQARLSQLERAIFGDYNRPTNPDGSPKSVIDILAEFEQRVFSAQNGATAASPQKRTQRVK